MEATSISTPNFSFHHHPLPTPVDLESTRLQFCSFGSSSFRPTTNFRFHEKRRLAAGHFAFREKPYGSDFDGTLVDENMIVLRKRINDAEMAERNYEPPPEWTEWEKGYYTSYGAHVCEFAGLLQALLMSTRPSLGLGFLGLIMLSVPISAAVVVQHLIQLSQLILSKVHLN